MKNRVGIEYNPHGWVQTKKEQNNKINKKNFISEIVHDYCSHATLHGIEYLGAKNKTLVEKIFWILVFIASLCFCFYLIIESWINWQNYPVILSFETEQTPIWKIPFPAVTVCPVNKVRQTYYNYTEMFFRRDSLTEDEYKRFWDISWVCNLQQYGNAEVNCSIDITDDMSLKNLVEVAPTKNSTLFFAEWMNSIERNIFAEHVNREGLCFTFNSLSQQDMYTKDLDSADKYINTNAKFTKWTMEDGYAVNSTTDEYPYRTAQDGFGSGLRFVLASYLPNIDHVCGFPISGYKIVLHNPVEPAKAHYQYFLLNTDRKATIMVTPQVTKTSKHLRYLSAQKRNCYFSNEKTLRFFKIYTQNNCQIECTANVTQKYCGCVPYYMPRDANTLICGYGKVDCIEEIEHKILTFRMMENGINQSEKEMSTLEYKIYNSCDCLPPCNDIQFAAELSETSVHIVDAAFELFHKSVIPPQVLESYKEKTLRLSQVDIFFKEPNFLSLKRSELYGTIDFVAKCGGLLGLFMGFSLLSVVEIIYFLTLRLWCKIKTRN